MYGRAFHDQGRNNQPEGVSGRSVRITDNPSNGVLNLQGVLSNTVTRGIVSGLHREVGTNTGSALTDVIGKKVRAEVFGHGCDLVPLPHPSGASTWHRTEPGKSLLVRGLALIAQHVAWQSLLDSQPSIHFGALGSS